MSGAARTRIVGIERGAATIANFWRKVDKNGPVSTIEGVEGCCWLWTGGTTGKNNYGVFAGGAGKSKSSSGFRLVTAHRYSFQLHFGDLSPDIEPDHKCRVRLCVNPAHLRPLSHRENVLSGNAPTAANARRTACLRGHPFDRVDGQGWRSCSVCDKAKRVRSAKARTQRRREIRMKGTS